MTLIEILAALALLSLFVSAVSTWMVGAVRRHQELSLVVDHEMSLDRTVAAMRADVAGGVAGTLHVESGGFSLITSSNLPGDAPGWNRVTWSIKDEHQSTRLVRRGMSIEDGGSQSQDRVVSARIESLRAEVDRTLTPPVLTVTLWHQSGDVRRLRWEVAP